MSKARLVITALIVEQQTVAEVAARYGVHRSWVYRLKTRYDDIGEEAFEPLSRRPHTSPATTEASTVELIRRLRKELTEAGLDAGPDTIAWHLTQRHQVTVSVSTVARTLTREGLVTPEPKKRPKSSYIRFEASMPNECWQSDFTHYRFTRPRHRAEVEIISWLDDCTRYALRVTAHHRVTTPIVLATFRETAGQHGIPAATLTDNGMVYTTRFAGGRGGRNGFEAQLRRLAGDPEELPTKPPHHLRKSGKVPADAQEVATSPADPAGHPGRTAGPHRRLRPGLQPPPTPPLTAAPSDPSSRSTNHCPKPCPPTTATPTPTTGSASTSVDQQTGNVTLRVHGRLRHIWVGRTHTRTHVLMLVQDLDVRVINATTGELLRELTINPTLDYQPRTPK